jgi:hypothetical protein
MAFIQCITKILEHFKSNIHKINVGSNCAYPHQTSILVLRWVSSNNTLYKSHRILTVLGILPYKSLVLAPFIQDNDQHKIREVTVVEFTLEVSKNKVKDKCIFNWCTFTIINIKVKGNWTWWGGILTRNRVHLIWSRSLLYIINNEEYNGKWKSFISL